MCLLTGEDGLRCGVRCNVHDIRGAYVWCNVQQYGSYWKPTLSVHPLPSLVISEYHSYQSFYVNLWVSQLSVFLCHHRSKRLTSYLDGAIAFLRNAQMLRYRDDVSDCHGVVSPCTNQLRRRQDVNDGGRWRHDEWRRKLWCHLRSNQSLSYRLDLPITLKATNPQWSRWRHHDCPSRGRDTPRYWRHPHIGIIHYIMLQSARGSEMTIFRVYFVRSALWGSDSGP